MLVRVISLFAAPLPLHSPALRGFVWTTVKLPAASAVEHIRLVGAPARAKILGVAIAAHPPQLHPAGRAGAAHTLRPCTLLHWRYSTCI